MKKIWVITLFPDYFKAFAQMGVASSVMNSVWQERQEAPFELKVLNLRDFVPGQYKSVDDTPYGGGPGMVMKADILKRCLDEGVLSHYPDRDRKNLHIVFPSPRGATWQQEMAKTWASHHLATDSSCDLVFICGRYEGIDERFMQLYVDECISLGDFILTGGELATLAILDSALRFVPGVLGNKLSNTQESFYDGLLEWPQYTRPFVFEGLEVPKELMSGHHQKIEEYRNNQRKVLTQTCRPDLWQNFKEQE